MAAMPGLAARAGGLIAGSKIKTVMTRSQKLAENIYECLMILDANAYARDPGGAANNIKEMVENCGGDLKASRLWEEKKLAYPIRGRHKGAYWLTYFSIPTDKLSGFNRACQLNDLLMRHMVIKIDPRISDTMIAVARGENKPSDSGTSDTNETSSTDAAESNKAGETVKAADA